MGCCMVAQEVLLKMFWQMLVVGEVNAMREEGEYSEEIKESLTCAALSN